MALQHPFFKAIELAESHLKLGVAWGMPGVSSSNRAMFYQALKRAHPWVFDRRCTHDRLPILQAKSGQELNIDTLVEDFSMPHSVSLYLLTDPFTLMQPMMDLVTKMASTTYGYLIQEKTPEKFTVFEVSVAELEKRPGVEMPLIHQFEIDLQQLRSYNWDELKEVRSEMFYMKHIASIMSLTSSISVKRIGIEKRAQVKLKTRGLGIGFTNIKYDNLIHVADKEEYEYTQPLAEGINWEFRGFWRGHWRAFYYPDTITDSFGRRVVDYTRSGKNREGQYTVPGYTWVTEHTKGDPALAEIKTHLVKKG